jgi:hypothetical protein
MAPNLPTVEGEFIPADSPNKKRHLTQKAKVSKDAQITEARWRHLIGLVADGMSTKLAVEQAGVRKFALEAHLRLDPKAKAQWEDAKTSALWRNWDLETIESILAHVAMGGTVIQGIDKYTFEHGADAHTQFYKLLLRDEIVKELYDEARQMQAEKMAIDDVLAISDNDADDVTDDGRPNAAAVNRSRLRVQSRQWIAERMSFKRFGDRKRVDLEANIVVDHAARLEEARRRKESIHSKRKENKDD